MTRIVHLTDLHFGSERRDLVQPLHHALWEAQPELIVVTGDLAHRARGSQFRQAMAFLHGVGLPFIVLPGNHDVPLYNLPVRWLMPFRGWRKHVSAELTPVAELGSVRIIAANTADPFRWRRGTLRDSDVQRIKAFLLNSPAGMINILACHHPFVEPPGFERGETRGAATALPELARDGLQIILAGHLHHWNIGLGITRTTSQPVFLLQTGTALCERPGERDHGFSVLDLQPQVLAVTPWLVDGVALTFVPRASRHFVRSDGRWHPASTPVQGDGADGVRGFED